MIKIIFGVKIPKAIGRGLSVSESLDWYRKEYHSSRRPTQQIKKSMDVDKTTSFSNKENSQSKTDCPLH